MLVIGMTGGIGTGKSTATEYLMRKGLGHIDADQIARDLTADGQPLLEIIGREFGCVESRTRCVELGVPNGEAGGAKDSPTEELTLDRRALAAVIFNDDVKRKSYELIIHTEIKKEIDRLIAEYEADGREAVILDAPLLFEAKIDDRCDFVILIIADKAVRIKRVCSRDGISGEEVEARINNQFSDELKITKADFVIDNSGGKEELYAQLDEILMLKKISKKLPNSPI